MHTYLSVCLLLPVTVKTTTSNTTVRIVRLIYMSKYSLSSTDVVEVRASALKQLNAPGISGDLAAQKKQFEEEVEGEVDSDSDVEFIMEEKVEGNESVELKFVHDQLKIY